MKLKMNTFKRDNVTPIWNRDLGCLQQGMAKESIVREIAKVWM